MHTTMTPQDQLQLLEAKKRQEELQELATTAKQPVADETFRLTDAEFWQYKCLHQEAVNAKMRRDMYMAEVRRAETDQSKTAFDIQAFLQALEKKYSISLQQYGIAEDGQLVERKNLVGR
jgi:hypothetical protein